MNKFLDLPSTLELTEVILLNVLKRVRKGKRSSQLCLKLYIIIMKIMCHFRKVFRIKYTNACIHGYHMQRGNNFSLTISEYTSLINLFKKVPQIHHGDTEKKETLLFR